jgi:hypothetical protein
MNHGPRSGLTQTRLSRIIDVVTPYLHANATSIVAQEPLLLKWVKSIVGTRVPALAADLRPNPPLLQHIDKELETPWRLAAIDPASELAARIVIERRRAQSHLNLLGNTFFEAMLPPR